MRLLPGLIFIAIPSAFAQFMVDTVAGGKIFSGVPAQSALLTVSGVTQDSVGNIYVCDGAWSVIRRIRPNGIIETIAGTGITGYSGDGGPAISADLGGPFACKIDAAGNLFFVDGVTRIRRIDTTGVITTVAGTGIDGTFDQDTAFGRTVGDTGPAAMAQIEVYDIVLDHDGNIYFSESNFNRIRRVTPAGRIERVAGIDQPVRFPKSTGDGGPALAAGLVSPTHLTIDPAGNIYFVDGVFGSTIRKIAPDGTISTVASEGPGSGSAGNGEGGLAIDAPLANITGLVADQAGNLYLSEQGFNATAATLLRKIGLDGRINTFAGTLSGSDRGDGPATDEKLTSARILDADPNGIVWFADTGPLGWRLRQVSAGAVKTVAGGSPMHAPDGIRARDAWFLNPTAITVSRSNELYIVESDCTIRKVSRDGILSTVAGTGKCGAGVAGFAPTIAVDSQNRVYTYTLGPPLAFTVLLIANGETTVLKNVPVGQLAVDSKDRLFVLQPSYVYRFPPEGAGAGVSIDLLAMRGLPAGGSRGASAFTVDEADNLYLAFRSSSVAWRIAADALWLASVAGSSITGLPGPVQSASSLVVDRAGNLWGPGAGPRAVGPGFDYRQVLGPGYSGDGGPLASAQFGYPNILASGPDGAIYVFEPLNRIRRITGAQPRSGPRITAIVNAASLTSGALAPGELVSIFGANLGPVSPMTAAPKNNQVLPVLGNVLVYIGGVTAPIAAISEKQINVFVPYSLASMDTADVVVNVDGVTSSSLTARVAKSAFGLFTADSSGSGQAAMLNQDGSYNSATNPAPAGSIVSLFGTGEGLTSPPLRDGAFAISLPLSTPVQAVSVSIGEQTAEIIYAGAAPFLPTGILQINARVPQRTPSGVAPITVRVGDNVTPKAVTLAVR